jgi:prevent-host-death family protein
MSTVPVTEMREKLSEVIDAVVTTGEEWVITRHGKPLAVVLSYDEYESLIETVNILSDHETMDAIREGVSDLTSGEDPEA